MNARYIALVQATVRSARARAANVSDLPQWLVIVYVFGVVDEVTSLLANLQHLQPTVRPGSDTLVFVTLFVTEHTGDSAGSYAKAAVERALQRSAMVQAVMEVPPGRA